MLLCIPHRRFNQRLREHAQKRGNAVGDAALFALNHGTHREFVVVDGVIAGVLAAEKFLVYSEMVALRTLPEFLLSSQLPEVIQLPHLLVHVLLDFAGKLPRIAVLPDGVFRKAGEIEKPVFRRDDCQNFALFQQRGGVAVLKPDDAVRMDGNALRRMTERPLRHHGELVARIELIGGFAAVAYPAAL